MQEAWELYRGAGTEALWRRCLGHMELAVEQTMAIQHRLLGEQLRLLDASPLGRRLFGTAHPENIDDLREVVPLTTYEDYAWALNAHREDVLPARPHSWIRTSGRELGGERWYPVSEAQYAQLRWLSMGLALATTAHGRGHVALTEGSRFLNFMPPPPYISGLLARAIEEMWPVRSYPPRELDGGDFQERSRVAVRQALEGGVDIVASLAAVMPRIGSRLGEHRGGSARELLRRPRTAARMARARAAAFAANRAVYPQDLWRIQGAVTGGVDSALFRDRIRAMWGREPLDTLINTEAGVIGFQAWDFTSMTLVPYLNFYEFLPDDEGGRERDDPGYRPRTVLIDGLEAGRNYELVVTNLLGGPVVRFRTGDIVRVTSMGNANIGSSQPQIVHYGRTGHLVEIGGFVRLSATLIGDAIAAAGIPVAGWSARKEVEGNDPVVHVRIEPTVGAPPEAEARRLLDRQLGVSDSNWADMAEIAGLHPLRVTYLPAGSFARYAARTGRAGLRPIADGQAPGVCEVNPDDGAIRELMIAGGAAET